MKLLLAFLCVIITTIAFVLILIYAKNLDKYIEWIYNATESLLEFLDKILFTICDFLNI